MNAHFRPQSKPSAQLLLTGLKDQVDYRCFCGREATTDRTTWEAGIHHCNCTGQRIPYPKCNLIGQRFRRLIVMAWAGKPQWDGISLGRSSQQHWQVMCDCGQTFCLPVDRVKCGKPKSCLCQPDTSVKPLPPKSFGPVAVNLTGQVFGKLTALHRIPRGEHKTHSAIWLCQCACGNTKEVAADNLKLGRVKSCGCLQHQLRVERGNELTGVTSRAKSGVPSHPIPE